MMETRKGSKTGLQEDQKLEPQLKNWIIHGYLVKGSIPFPWTILVWSVLNNSFPVSHRFLFRTP